jgi:hypothetical protein
VLALEWSTSFISFPHTRVFIHLVVLVDNHIVPSIHPSHPRFDWLDASCEVESYFNSHFLMFGYVRVIYKVLQIEDEIVH